MVKRIDPFMPGFFYHIYNRGVNRSEIFFDSENLDFFVRRLRKYIVGETANLATYVLMPNHYHLLVQIKNDHFSNSMQKFAISFTKALNERYHRTGPIFEGAFKSKRLETDEDIINLSRYIHLNPIEAGLASKPEDWSYSGYRTIIGLENAVYIKKEILLRYFETSSDPSELQAQQRYKEFTESDIGEK